MGAYIMKKVLIVFLIAMLLLDVVSALTASEAKSAWQGAKKLTLPAKAEYSDAKIVWAADRTPEKDKEVVDTGKNLLNVTLDEAKAWLIWKNLEAEEMVGVPQVLIDTIKLDVDTRIKDIDRLREDINDVRNQFDLGVVFVRMIGKYMGLVTDVARDSGKMWAQVADTYGDRIGEYENKLRTVTESIPNNKAMLAKLDAVDSEVEKARQNIREANTAYDKVRLTGTPLLSFAEGNSYLSAAKTNLLSAQIYLGQAYDLMARGG
jgi:hypothetical protein